MALEKELAISLPAQLRALFEQCDGFREDRGNAKYLLSLTAKDYIGSVLSTTRSMWSHVASPDLRPFVFFGFSGNDEVWGISTEAPDRIVAYHHHMESKYKVIGSDILKVYKTDYALYEEFE